MARYRLPATHASRQGEDYQLPGTSGAERLSPLRSASALCQASTQPGRSRYAGSLSKREVPAQLECLLHSRGIQRWYERLQGLEILGVRPESPSLAHQDLHNIFGCLDGPDPARQANDQPLIQRAEYYSALPLRLAVPLNPTRVNPEPVPLLRGNGSA